MNTLNFSSRRHELKAFLSGLVTNTLTIVQHACLSLMWILDKMRKKATNIWQILTWSFSSKVKYYFWFLLFISFFDVACLFWWFPNIHKRDEIFIYLNKPFYRIKNLYNCTLFSSLLLSSFPHLNFFLILQILEECTQYYLFIIPSHFTFKGKGGKVVH